MAEPEYIPESEPSLRIRISRSLEADYRRRGVFPTLRMKAADQLARKSAAVVEMSIQLAHEALEDALEAREHANTPRYARAAYTAFSRQLRQEIDWLKRAGTVPDPGFDKALSLHFWPHHSDDRMTFRKGDLCLIHSPGSSLHSTAAVVVKPFYLYCVREDSGPYWCDKTRKRIGYRWGYVCQTLDGQEYFYPASNLRNPDGTARHIQLA